jgi:D-sedoheptulose 7-phosphate isomerase
MKMNIIKNDFLQAFKVLDEFISNDNNISLIEKAGNIMANSLEQGGKIISCGNGGSMSDAIHFAEELTGMFRSQRPSLAGIAISDPGYLSCTANDLGYDHVFSRFIEGLGKPEDTLLAISTSGNSTNVIHAITKAKEMGMKTIGLTGKTGGKAAGLVDIEIRAPFSEFSDRTQEIHIIIIHALIHFIEQHFYPE